MLGSSTCSSCVRRQRGPTQVTTGLTAGAPVTGNPIKWSPDDQSLAVIATWGGRREPFVVPLDGSGQRRVLNVAATTATTESVDWSDDGSQIFVVADYLTDAQFELFRSTPRPPTRPSRTWCSMSWTAARSISTSP